MDGRRTLMASCPADRLAALELDSVMSASLMTYKHDLETIAGMARQEGSALSDDPFVQLAAEGLLVEVRDGGWESAPGVSQRRITQRLAELAREWAEPHSAACVARGDWRGALALYSSEARPGALLDLWPQIPKKERAAVLLAEWSGFDLPGFVYEWLSAFREVAYIGQVPRPTAPVRLFRGVVASRHRRGLSWTS
jgi:hypothetical protein